MHVQPSLAFIPSLSGTVNIHIYIYIYNIYCMLVYMFFNVCAYIVMSNPHSLLHRASLHRVSRKSWRVF